MTHYKIAQLNSLESRAEQVLDIIRDSGMEIVDSSLRVCDPEVRQAYLFGLKEGIFNNEEVEEAQRLYWSREQTRRALESVDMSYGRINSGGGWTSEGSQATAREEVQRDERRRRNGW